MTGDTAWFPGWMMRHHRRHGVSAPDPKSEDGLADYETLRRQFDRLALTEQEADELTEALRIEGPTARTHLRRLVELAKEAVAGRAETAVIGDREAAENQSRGCIECGGGGLTTRRVRLARLPYDPGMSFYCHLCPMGRWMKESHREYPELAGRILDLCDHPSLWDQPYEGPRVASVRDAIEAVKRGLFNRVESSDRTPF
jgi:hypothetical protein